MSITQQFSQKRVLAWPLGKIASSFTDKNRIFKEIQRQLIQKLPPLNGTKNFIHFWFLRQNNAVEKKVKENY